MSSAQASTAHPSSASWAWLVAGCGLLTAHALHFDHLSDDAYISMRYADHWLRGDGLVFNVGERVVGYSNFAWVLLLALLGRIGVDLPAAARGLGVVCSLAALACVWHSVRPRGSWATLAAMAWLAASGPFALWTLGGLEGPLFALALVAAVASAWSCRQHRSRRSVLALVAALVAATLTRPEGIAYAVPIAAWLALGTRGGSGGRDPAEVSQQRAAAAVALGAAGLAWAAQAGFYSVYYGDWLPNTYYAKWHPLSAPLLERGLAYTRHYVAIHNGAPALVLVLWTATCGRSLRARGWLAIAVVAAFVVYYLRIGGDALVYYRMWAFVQPLLALLLADAVAELDRSLSGRSARTAALAATALLLPAAGLPNSFRGFEVEYLRGDDQRIRSLADVGRSLAASAPRVRIASNVIGALGYESRLPVIDMLGLTDPHIARAARKTLGTPGHEAHDGSYVLDRQPELILVGIPRAVQRKLSAREAFQPSFPSDSDLLADPRFTRDYRFGHYALGDGRQVALFARRDSARIAGFTPLASSAPSDSAAEEDKR